MTLPVPKNARGMKPIHVYMMFSGRPYNFLRSAEECPLDFLYLTPARKLLLFSGTTVSWPLTFFGRRERNIHSYSAGLA